MLEHDNNLARWRYYNKDIISPNSYIDMAFYGMIGAFLQRRVWIGGDRERDALFGNLYIIPTGPPGTGKGRIIKQVSYVLRHFKMEEKDKDIMYNKEEQKADINYTTNATKGERPLLVPVGADATTYEALVKAMSSCIRSCWPEVEGKKRLYAHSSLVFCLEEISSLFRKHTEDLVNFLLVAYDCGSYRYQTISRGIDYIHNCCLNLIAGTTPGFIKRVFGDELLTDGFASRAIFVCENYPRFYNHKPATFSEAQIYEHNKILIHCKELTKLYGEVKLTEEADKFMEYWWKGEAQTNKPNKSHKLEPYYARKNITVLKMAMAIHFADSLKMEIGIEEIHKAIEVLADIERRMHNALVTEGKNPLADPSDRIFRFLCNKGKTSKTDLLVAVWEYLPQGEDSLTDIIEYLSKTKKIKISIEGNNKPFYEANIDQPPINIIKIQ